VSVPVAHRGEQAAEADARVAAALAAISAAADDLDRHPRFPSDAFSALAGAGVTGATLGATDAGERGSFHRELALVRAVARADGSVGRILDGHFNAVERLCTAVPPLLAPDDRQKIDDGRLLLGVWGADPAKDEGRPAVISTDGSGRRVLLGVKTFCSGAGGVQRALIIASDEQGARRLAYVDVTRGTQIDRSWYRGDGLRASESHRVSFDRAPVLAVIGEPGEMLREPWFSRDALRTSATWAGIADRVFASALDFLRERGAKDDLVALSVGRMQVALGTIDRWLADAARQADGGASLAHLSVQGRWAIAAACREVAAEAARSCGSRPLTRGGGLSRGRRDLDLFLLQHRLEPLLARHGRTRLEAS